MDKPSFSGSAESPEGASRRRMLTGTAAGLATALLQPGCALRPSGPEHPPVEGPPGSTQAKAASSRMMSEHTEIPLQDFMELSAVLSGLRGIVEDQTMQPLHQATAEEYWRRLHAEFPDALTELVSAYRRVISATGRPPLGDALLERLRITPEFKKEHNFFVARQIINIWYLSQFDIEERNDSREPAVLDGGFHDRSMVWPLIKAHPPGVIDKSYRTYRSWADQP